MVSTKWLRALKSLLTTPSVKNTRLDFSEPVSNSSAVSRAILDAMPMGYLAPSEESRNRTDNRKIAQAQLDAQIRTANENLKVQHRTMMVALAGVFVALLTAVIAVIIALTTKPPVLQVLPPSSPVTKE